MMKRTIFRIIDFTLVLGIAILLILLLSDDQNTKKSPSNPFQSFPFSRLKGIEFPSKPFQIHFHEEGLNPILHTQAGKSLPLAMENLQAYLDHFLILPELQSVELLENQAAYGFGEEPDILFQFRGDTLRVNLGSGSRIMPGKSYILIQNEAFLLPEVILENMRPRLEKFLPRTLHPYLKTRDFPIRLRNSFGQILEGDTKESAHRIRELLNVRGIILSRAPSKSRLSGFSMEILWKDHSQIYTGLIDHEGVIYLEVIKGFWLRFTHLRF